MDQAASSYKVEDRKKVYAQIDRKLLHDGSARPGNCSSPPRWKASASTVQGYQPNLLSKPIFRGVWLSK